MISEAIKTLAALSVFTLLAIAQEPSVTMLAPTVTPDPPEPLDLGHKYLYSLDRIAGPAAWIGFGVGAGIDQIWKKPAYWGSTTESFGVRMADHFGAVFLHENIAFGVRALDHEDPRYFRSGHGSGLTRARYALVHTFAVHNDNGSLMPAYSLFVASYATPAVAHVWRPGPFTLGRDVRGGSIGLSIGVAENLFREFAPDLRQLLPKRFR